METFELKLEITHANGNKFIEYFTLTELKELESLILKGGEKK